MKHGSNGERTHRFQNRARSDADKARVREHLLEAARREFSARDPRDVSIRRIAEAAGYSKGTLYTYFPSKTSLYHCVKEDIFRHVIDRIEEAIHRQSDPKKQLVAALRMYVEYWIGNLDHFRIMFSRDVTIEERRLPDGTYFGESEIAVRAYRVFLRTLQRYLAHLGVECEEKTAAYLTATLLAASHGTVSMPLSTLTMRMPRSLGMHDLVVGNLIEAWESRIEETRGTQTWPRMTRTDFYAPIHSLLED